jgi:hypothetical protein
MAHGGEDHLEEAEHASHASHDPFDRRVALTMVLIAAVLAAVKLLGHRAHTESLRFQIQTDVQHTQATDRWNLYQAKKLRQHLYESQADLLGALGKAGDGRSKQWLDRASRYQKEGEEEAERARALEEQAGEFQHESEHMHHRSDRYDLGEMGVELALVLCSVAILARRAAFWYSGIAVGVLGVAAAVSGMLL